MNSNKSLAHVHLGGAVAAFFLAAGLTLHAADTTNAARPATGSDDVVSMQNYVVTGSNILRLDMEKIAPVTVLNMDAFNARMAFTPVELLTSLPQVINLPENETRLGSSGARGDNANINLRNLGATGTLILIDGRRMAVNPMTAGLSQAVNINQLPTQGIDHVEVLRDGASAIYGSDAVAGVVNYVMRRDFVGTELDFRYGEPEGRGGSYSQASLTYGRKFANGRGRVVFTGEYLFRESIHTWDRWYSRNGNQSSRAPAPFNALGGPFDPRTNRGYYPTFRVGTSTTANYFLPINGAMTLTTTTPTRTANPDFFLDLNVFSWTQPRTHRGNSFLSLEYDLTPTLTAFADFGYYKSQSTMVRQPLALNAPTTDALAVMSADNPYNPYGSKFYDPAGAPGAGGAPRLVGTPRTVSLVSVTMPDLNAESIKTRADVVRFTAGLKGRIGTEWRWEAAGFYNEVDGRDDAYPDVRESLMQQALARTGADAYNPFGYTFKVQGNAVVADAPYQNPKSVTDSFAATFSRNAKSSLLSGDIRASGPVAKLWAGKISAAAGFEYRRETLDDLRPPFSGENPASSGLDPLNNDFLLHPPRPDVRGRRNVNSLYVETVIPLVAPANDLPLVNTLELTASARREHYSDFGTTTKPKIGANWRPLPSIMFRGSYNEGFMAPSLAALYTSPRWSITAGAGNIDLYRNPVTNEGPYVARNYFGGNPALKASESKGRTGGVVIDVPFVKGLSVTADYWKITRTNLLGSRSSTQVATSDAALLQAYTKEQLAAGKSIGQIDLGSGTASYKGDPDITRFAPTAADVATFAAYNASHPGSQQAVVGRIEKDNTPFVNLASSYDEGWDFSLNYVLPRNRLGNVTFNSEWSYIVATQSTLLPANLAPIVTDSLNVNGASRWRGTTTIAWRQGPWSAALGGYYAGESMDSGATTTEAIYESLGRPSYIAKHFTEGRYVYRYVMGEALSYNLSAGYSFGAEANRLLRRTKFRVGVINLFNREPPLASGAFGYSPSVSSSMSVGRTWTFEMTRSF